MSSVIQASAWYPPAHLGGTEVYVSGLVRELKAFDVISTIVAPLWPLHPDNYYFEATPVRTYPGQETQIPAELRSGRPSESFLRFREILAEVRPDVYHQHGWTSVLGLQHLRAARELGLRTVLTVHLAGVTCMRGTMMRYGKEACDGRIDPLTCAACWSHGQGAPKPVALALAAASSTMGSRVGNALLPARLSTALSAPTLLRQRRADVVAMANYADRIVAVCQWLYDALVINGVPREKLILSRQGVDCEFATAVTSIKRRKNAGGSTSGPFRLLFLGHWQSLKGIDILVRAVRTLSADLPLELVIHCAGDGPEERAYQASVRALAGDDPRIRIEAPVPRAALPQTFIQADAIAVPSRCLETGPLVVLEAKAAGLPILGSRLGGIAELVNEPEDGVLIPPDDVRAWADAILRMMKMPSSQSMRTVPQVRTMREVAAETSALYREICDRPIPIGASSCVLR